MTEEERFEIGKRILALREERGISLGELERISGVTKGYLSQLERGEAQNPSLEAVRKIAMGLGVKLSELVGETGAPERSARRLPKGLREFLEAAEEEGHALTEEDVEMLLGIRYRGRQPKTKDDFELLYGMIKRLVR